MKFYPKTLIFNHWTCEIDISEDDENFNLMCAGINLCFILVFMMQFLKKIYLKYKNGQNCAFWTIFSLSVFQYPPGEYWIMIKYSQKWFHIWQGSRNEDLATGQRVLFVKKIWSLHFSFYIDIFYIIRSAIECRFWITNF